MQDHEYRRNTKVLWSLIVVSTIYSLWFYSLHTLTGFNTVDGVLSMLIGLYICSHPAANAIDLLFLERRPLRRVTSDWISAQWLALNLLTLLMGWIVIVIGTTRLTGRAI